MSEAKNLEPDLKPDLSKKIGKTSTGKRKFHQKSRSGCLTCKKRRVKCDEARPVCQKCQHMNLVCGYSVDSSQGPESGKHVDRTEADEPVEKEQTSTRGPDSRRLTGNLLNAGNLNNLNLSHLVNILSGLGGDLSSLGNLASLNNLATLAQLPIDLSNIGSLIDSQIHKSVTEEPRRNQSRDQSRRINPELQQQQPHSHMSWRKEESAGTENTETQTIQGQLDTAALQNGPFGDTSTNFPKISPNVNTLGFGNSSMNAPMPVMGLPNLNMLDLRLMFHYTTQVSKTITGAGISDANIWNNDVPMLAFNFPYLMHSLLAFSATHLSRTEKGLDQCVTSHRGEALRLLREAVLDINSDNTDALVASALILIMDALANASLPLSTSPKSLPASAWIFHVKGAATILTAVWPLTEASRFFKFISVDLGDLGDIINQRVGLGNKPSREGLKYFTDLECYDPEIADMFPIEIDSPYLITLAYLNKLHKERSKSDFILRVFAFPALLDKAFLSLLMAGDVKAMRVMRSYYKLLRSFTSEVKDKVWFLEGVSLVLPVDVDEYAGGAGGMHMMLDFLGGGPAIVDNEIDDELTNYDPTGALDNRLSDTDNLPSDITSNLEVMQGDNGFINIR